MYKKSKVNNSHNDNDDDNKTTWLPTTLYFATLLFSERTNAAMHARIRKEPAWCLRR